MSLFFRTIFATIVLIASSLPVCFAADFYVSTAGSDANAGTQALPFLTIQKGCDSASAGSTIYVMAGVYSERVTIAKSGNASDGFITLRNFGTDAVAIDATGLIAPEGASALIWIQDQSYVCVQGLELRNYSTTKKNLLIAGIYMTGLGDQLQMLNCHVHNIANNTVIPNGGLGRDAHGIAAYGTTALTNVVISGCEVDHCTLGSSESMVVNGNVDVFQIVNNTVHDNDNIGIDMIGWEKTAKKNDQARGGSVQKNTVYNIHSKGNPAYGNDSSADGIYVDGGRDSVIERNRVYQCDFGIEVGCEHKGKTASGVIVRDNIVYACVVAGLAFGGYDLQRGTTLDCQFLNNTFFQNDTSNSYTGEVNVQVSKTNVFKNNILYATSQNVLITNPFAKAKSLNNVFDYNLYFCPGGNANSNWNWNKKDYQGFDNFRKGSKQDAHSKFADPLFTSTGSPPDLSLQNGSPAIDAGDPSITPAPGETDFAGGARQNGPAMDIGAYEK